MAAVPGQRPRLAPISSRILPRPPSLCRAGYTIDEGKNSAVLDQVKRGQQLTLHLQSDRESEAQRQPPEPMWHVDGQPDHGQSPSADFPLPQEERTREAV